jgi:hypothetical protein
MRPFRTGAIGALCCRRPRAYLFFVDRAPRLAACGFLFFFFLPLRPYAAEANECAQRVFSRWSIPPLPFSIGACRYKVRFFGGARRMPTKGKGPKKCRTWEKGQDRRANL